MDKATREAKALELTNAIVDGIQEKKGHNIVRIDLRNTSGAVCDYFVICHGDSDRQVLAIADAVADETRKQLSDKPWHREGMNNAEWVLLDYVNVVVHVFHRESREFYNLEGLWADAEIEEIEELA